MTPPYDPEDYDWDADDELLEIAQEQEIERQEWKRDNDPNRPN